MALPETLVRAKQMNNELKGKRIERVHLKECDPLIKYGFTNLHEVDLAGMTVRDVTGKGYWIYIKLDTDMYLLLGEISGKILYHTSRETLPDMYHLKLDFTDNTFLTIRIAGWCFAKAASEQELESHRYPGHLGLSPLHDEFTFQAFNNILDRFENKMTKYVLLRQEEIAGIGNLYLLEILFKAKIHPKRKVIDITASERKILYEAIKGVLNEALQVGGSEIDLYGNSGNFRRILSKHMKGQPCPTCGAVIEKLNVLGSAAYVCPSCQK